MKTNSLETNSSLTFFDSIEPAPPDSILGLNEAFKKDPASEKINLTVGVYQDDQGRTPVFECIQVAENRLLQQEGKSKSYLGIAGIPEYAVAVQELLFGTEHPIVEEKKAATIQSPGGTGALRISADFIQHRFPQATVWFSQPTWANHPAIFSAAGLGIESYAYLDANRTGLDFEGMKSDLEKAKPGDVVVLHGCCHNPTGIDLSNSQWKEIGEFLKLRGLLPLVDCAYQGFNEGLREDVAGIHELYKAGLELIICSSFSKNLGLYGERVGAATVVAHQASSAEAALSHLKKCVRVNYSNPPKHGAALATMVLTDEELRRIWFEELEKIRNRIRSVRTRFVEEMNRRCQVDFSFIEKQNGMFSFSGLTPMQVDRLKNEYSIYIVGAGRINVAGINEGNLNRLCDSLAEVINDS